MELEAADCRLQTAVMVLVSYASMSLYTKQKGQRTRVLSVWELGLPSTMVNIKFKSWVKSRTDCN